MGFCLKGETLNMYSPRGGPGTKKSGIGRARVGNFRVAVGYGAFPYGRKILTRPTAHTGTSFLYGWTLGKVGQKLTCKTLHGPVKILHGPAKSKPIFKWKNRETEVVYINYDAKVPKTDRYPKNSVPENWNWDRSILQNTNLGGQGIHSIQLCVDLSMLCVIINIPDMILMTLITVVSLYIAVQSSD